jgi:hypothetical protein
VAEREGKGGAKEKVEWRSRAEKEKNRARPSITIRID